MQVKHVSGFRPYGGISPAYASKDGFYYWGMIGTGYQGFAYYVFRTDANGNSAYVAYSPQVHHGNLSVDHVGLILTGYFQYGTADQVNTYITHIQGFIPLGDLSQVDYPSVIATPVNGVDDVARGLIKDLTQTVNKKADDLNALRKQVNDHLTNHPSSQQPAPTTPSGGLTAAQVADIVWSKVGDRLYYETSATDNPKSAINDNTHYLAGLIRKYAPATVNVPLLKAEIKAEVKAELTTALTTSLVPVIRDAVIAALPDNNIDVNAVIQEIIVRLGD